MLGCSEGATIVMLPAIGKSHFLVFERVAEELTDRGYEVWLLVLSEKKVGMLIMSEEIEQYRSEKLGYFACCIWFFFSFLPLKMYFGSIY